MEQAIEKPPVTDVVELGVTDTALKELHAKYKGMDARKDYDATKTGIAECRTLRGKVERRRQEVKAPYLDACRSIDKRSSDITVALSAIENPMKDSRAEVDAEKKSEKEKAERIEQERVEAIKSNIDELFGMRHFNELVNGTADELKARIDKIKGIKVGDEFQEFVILADQSQASILSALEHLKRSKRVQEEAAEKQRIQDAKLAEEREKLEAEKERVAKEQAAEQARIDEEKAKLRRAEEKRIAEEKAREDAAQAAQAEKERIAQEEEARIKAEEDAKREAERQEALRPEKERLMQFADVMFPRFVNDAFALATSPEGEKIMEAFVDRISEARDQLTVDIANM